MITNNDKYIDQFTCFVRNWHKLITHLIMFVQYYNKLMMLTVENIGIYNLTGISALDINNRMRKLWILCQIIWLKCVNSVSSQLYLEILVFKAFSYKITYSSNSHIWYIISNIPKSFQKVLFPLFFSKKI